MRMRMLELGDAILSTGIRELTGPHVALRQFRGGSMLVPTLPSRGVVLVVRLNERLTGSCDSTSTNAIALAQVWAVLTDVGSRNLQNANHRSLYRDKCKHNRERPTVDPTDLTKVHSPKRRHTIVNRSLHRRTQYESAKCQPSLPRLQRQVQNTTGN